MSKFEAGDDCTETINIESIIPNALYNAGIELRL